MSMVSVDLILLFVVSMGFQYWCFVSLYVLWFLWSCFLGLRGMDKDGLLEQDLLLFVIEAAFEWACPCVIWGRGEFQMFGRG